MTSDMARTAGGPASQLVDGLVELVYPRHCVACEKSIHDEPDAWLCAQCLAGLPRVSQHRCPKCGHDLAEYAADRVRCRSCQGKSLYFVSACAPFRYDGAARALILRMKLAQQTVLALPLARHLGDFIGQAPFLPSVELIVPVPLHWWRHLTRGYNQSHLIAGELARRFGLRLDECLVRVRHTRSQTSLELQKRAENIRGAFAMRRPGALRGKTLLLIDDVLTTGATCAECSRVLIQDGKAAAVYVATVARTMLTT